MSLVRELLEHPSLSNGREARSHGPAQLSPSDLADLMARFEESARALQSTHETLQSEVRRLEGELRETKFRLRRAQDLAALGEMAAGIAHEIRNPLGSIRLYAEMLVEDLADRPQECSIAEKVARAVDSLNGVVGDVLVFSREIRVCPQVVDLGTVFSHAVEACEAVVKATGVRVAFEIDSQTEVLCDPTLIHQALVNVVRNAIEAASELPGEPRVVLSTSVRTVLNEEGRRATMRSLCVEDNGPGVPPEVHERMFNPFFTTRHTGTGLGLAIVHRILDAHSGRVNIRNKADARNPDARGAVVELLIPETHSEHQATNGHCAHHPPTPPPTTPTPPTSTPGEQP